MLNRKRLKALVESNNGFELAEKDLEIRGPGVSLWHSAMGHTGYGNARIIKYIFS